jgi:hypothetical protein
VWERADHAAAGGGGPFSCPLSSFVVVSVALVDFRRAFHNLALFFSH